MHIDTIRVCFHAPRKKRNLLNCPKKIGHQNTHRIRRVENHFWAPVMPQRMGKMPMHGDRFRMFQKMESWTCTSGQMHTMIGRSSDFAKSRIKLFRRISWGKLKIMHQLYAKHCERIVEAFHPSLAKKVTTPICEGKRLRCTVGRRKMLVGVDADGHRETSAQW